MDDWEIFARISPADSHYINYHREVYFHHRVNFSYMLVDYEHRAGKTRRNVHSLNWLAERAKSIQNNRCGEEKCGRKEINEWRRSNGRRKRERERNASVGEESGGEIERSACRMDERMRESGTRNCTALEKIAFPLIISSYRG